MWSSSTSIVVTIVSQLQLLLILSNLKLQAKAKQAARNRVVQMMRNRNKLQMKWGTILAMCHRKPAVKNWQSRKRWVARLSMLAWKSLRITPQVVTNQRERTHMKMIPKAQSSRAIKWRRRTLAWSRRKIETATWCTKVCKRQLDNQIAVASSLITVRFKVATKRIRACLRAVLRWAIAAILIKSVATLKDHQQEIEEEESKIKMTM